mmetsp:Transcript_38200/g.43814  ORF Transcript_38200/g.43814 Transcript_38200/m.43814 type:complete len:149 (+) Transcript_38200:733-1179(+)
MFPSCRDTSKPSTEYKALRGNPAAESFGCKPLQTRIDLILNGHLLAESRLESLKHRVSADTGRVKSLYSELLSADAENADPNMMVGMQSGILAVKVSRKQWKGFVSRMNCRPIEKVKEFSDALFDYYDGNADGYITYAEFVEELLPKI